MSNTPSEKSNPGGEASTKFEELQTFLFLTVVLAPVVAFVCVGGYGFAVWMSQLILGPPGV